MARFGIGQAVRRVEDVRFLKGAGNYVGDIALPGELYGVVVYSTQAHARIKRVDASKAQAAPGVVLVLTGADAIADKIGALPPAAMPEDIGGPKGYRTFRPVLVRRRGALRGRPRRLRGGRDRGRGARCRRARSRSTTRRCPPSSRSRTPCKPGAPAVWAECPSNISYTVGLRRRGGHQSGLRRRQARRLRQARQQPRVGQLHGGARRARPVRPRRGHATPSTPARRTRSASA